MTPNSYLKLRVHSVVEETHDARSLLFDVPSELESRFRYRPGQFLTLRIPHQGRHLPRCYSLASSPLLAERLRVTVKRVAEGRGSNWVCDRVAAGDEIEVLPPSGVFTPDSLEGDFLLFAGGSGITPVYSILRSALKSGSGKITLIYANRDERSVIFARELRELAAAHTDRLQVQHWLDSVQGFVSVPQLIELARPKKGAQAFICGPAAFMDAAAAALHELEWPSDDINVERFVSLPDEEDTPAVAAETPEGAPTSIELYLDGAWHTLSGAQSEPMLDAMLRADLRPPHSCRTGSCGSCMCVLESGQVDLRNNEVLDKNDLAEGWTLACQAYAKSSSVRIRFPD